MGLWSIIFVILLLGVNLRNTFPELKYIMNKYGISFI